MPNWCNNSLQLTAATKEEADELHSFLKTYQDAVPEGQPEPTFFGFFVPEDYEEDEDGNKTFPNWYSWRIENWGTKWDASMHDWHWVDDYTVVMTFDTAWGPAIGVYEAMMEQGWGVSATYYEPGMCFVGSWVDGVDEHYDYAHCETPAEITELVGDDLDDEWGISYWMEQYQEEERQWEEEQERKDVQEAEAMEQAEKQLSSEDSGVEYFGKT